MVLFLCCRNESRYIIIFPLSRFSDSSNEEEKFLQLVGWLVDGTDGPEPRSAQLPDDEEALGWLQFNYDFIQK